MMSGRQAFTNPLNIKHIKANMKYVKLLGPFLFSNMTILLYN